MSNQTKKYEFTDQTMQYEGRTLRRIRRLKDGLLGGWIEREYNLSHEGECFVYSEAKVYGEAWVCGNAKIHTFAEVGGKAEVCGNAEIYGEAKVLDEALVHGNAQIYENATVQGKSLVCGDAKVHNEARVNGSAKVNHAVRGKTEVWGEGKLNPCLNPCPMCGAPALRFGGEDWVGVICSKDFGCRATQPPLAPPCPTQEEADEYWNLMSPYIAEGLNTDGVIEDLRLHAWRNSKAKLILSPFQAAEVYSKIIELQELKDKINECINGPGDS